MSKIKGISFLASFVIIFIITAAYFIFFNFEETYLGFIKDKNPIDFKYCYRMQNDTAYPIFGISTKSDIENYNKVLKLHYPCNDLTWNSEPIDLSINFKYNVLAYKDSLAIILIEKGYVRGIGESSDAVYIPKEYLHDSIPQNIKVIHTVPWCMNN